MEHLDLLHERWSGTTAAQTIISSWPRPRRWRIEIGSGRAAKVLSQNLDRGRGERFATGDTIRGLARWPSC
jgi:hypothetical protein